MLNKILVAIDRSDKNQDVFDNALFLAIATQASLMLVNVISETEAGYPHLPTYNYYPVFADREVDLYRARLEEYEKWGLDLLQNLSDKARERGITTEFTQLKGNPGRGICDLAVNCSADLIVIGSRGLSGLKEMFLGSVSNYVTHHAPCSVLIARTSVTK
jgi:nucleotide-binding universal stress UspA family protein